MNKSNLPTNSEGRIIGGRRAIRKVAEAELRIVAERTAREADVKRAENLRKSRGIANVKPGTGPRIAR